MTSPFRDKVCLEPGCEEKFTPNGPRQVYCPKHSAERRRNHSKPGHAPRKKVKKKEPPKGVPAPVVPGKFVEMRLSRQLQERLAVKMLCENLYSYKLKLSLRSTRTENGELYVLFDVNESS